MLFHHSQTFIEYSNKNKNENMKMMIMITLILLIIFTPHFPLL